MTESLLVHGGNCPHCFGVIPGEESATDPGEAVRTQLREADVEKVRARSRRQWLAIAPILLALVGVVGWALMPEPPVEPLVMDEDFNIPLVSMSKAAAGKQGGAPKVAQGQQNAPKKDGAAAPPTEKPDLTPPPEVAGGGLGAEGLADRLRQDGQAGAGMRGVAGAGDLKVGGPDQTASTGAVGATGGGSLSAPSIMASRRGALLTEDADIKRAVRDMTSAGTGGLQRCYENALKLDENLGGTWYVSFTIGKDGALTRVVPETGGDNDNLDTCIKNAMGKWTLGATLAKERTLRVPFRFEQ